jgi:hypothetical protein
MSSHEPDPSFDQKQLPGFSAAHPSVARMGNTWMQRQEKLGRLPSATEIAQYEIGVREERERLVQFLGENARILRDELQGAPTDSLERIVALFSGAVVEGTLDTLRTQLEASL